MKQSQKIERVVFLVCACLIIMGLFYLYGVQTVHKRLFPYPQLRMLQSTALEVLGRKTNPLLDLPISDTEAIIRTGAAEDIGQGLVLIVHAIPDTRDSRVGIIDRDGNTIHEWMPRWDEIWPSPEAEAFSKDVRPVPGDGMYLHGIDVLPDGSYVANYEHLSSFRMDVCGEVMWKKENLGHHAVYYDQDDNTIWLTTENKTPSTEPSMYNVRDWTLQQVSLGGEVLREISVVDILKKNGLIGLLYLASLHNESVAVRGDTLHLNDVEIFPEGYDSTVFAPGDIMFSLRNINAVFVVDPETLEIKFKSVGQVLRQHDPDFTPDGNITVFNNNNLQPTIGPDRGQSYILRIDTETNEIETLAGDREENRFFTDIMGTHQVLPNGNILVNSSGQGRVFEFSPEGDPLWRWSNLGTNGSNNRIYGVIGLPPEMDAAFFEEAVAACPE